MQYLKRTQPNYLDNSYFIIPLIVKNNIFVHDTSFVKSTAKTVGFMNILTMYYKPNSVKHFRYLIHCAALEKNLYNYILSDELLCIKFLAPMTNKIEFMNISKFGFDAITKVTLKRCLLFYN